MEKGEISRNKHEYKYLFSYIEAIKLIANTFKKFRYNCETTPSRSP